ncbi:MAG: hypothetical protein R2711_19190 [Acidimicrobiales bacterium]
MPDQYRAPTGEVTVTGLVRRSEARAHQAHRPGGGTLDVLARLDVVRLDQQVDGDLLPFYLQLQEQVCRPSTTTTPSRWTRRKLGACLYYAIQWFTFSTLTVVVYAPSSCARRRRTSRSAATTSSQAGRQARPDPGAVSDDARTRLPRGDGDVPGPLRHRQDDGRRRRPGGRPGPGHGVPALPRREGQLISRGDHLGRGAVLRRAGGGRRRCARPRRRWSRRWCTPADVDERRAAARRCSRPSPSSCSAADPVGAPGGGGAERLPRRAAAGGTARAGRRSGGPGSGWPGWGCHSSSPAGAGTSPTRWVRRLVREELLVGILASEALAAE